MGNQCACRKARAQETDIAGGDRRSDRRKKKGRIRTRTLFDSTGIALWDSATIPLEYEGRRRGVGIEKKDDS
jgi:hypothetical protein